MTSVNESYVWSGARFGHDYPVTLTETLSAVDNQIVSGDTRGFRPLALGFTPLDEILGGGLRAGDLMVLGGGYGGGKTIFALQCARNVVHLDPGAYALYICFEHEPAHLMSRLLCLESALAGLKQEALTLRRLDAMIYQEGATQGLEQRLRQTPRYAPIVKTMDAYASRLIFLRAGGATGTVTRIREWVQDVLNRGASRALIVIDYVQKIPVSGPDVESEDERTIRVIQDIKEVAMVTGARVLGIAAMTQEGLRSRRMRLSDMRGGTALQYEADVGLVLHNKHSIVSREHLVYNPGTADEMRNWLVMSIEKNRAGAGAVDMEFALEAAHFRIVSEGRYVRDRLVDEKVVLD
ncbi:MAG: DnaB-like helicase C-terminal domain-containing protein [Anaerolineae bacterium]